MKRSFSSRVPGVLISLGILFLFILLAVSLQDLQFLPGRIIPQEDDQSIQVSVEKIVEEIVSIPFWKQVVFWVSAFFIVLSVALLFPPELRRRIIRYFIRLAAFIIALYFIFKNFRWLFPNLSLNMESQSGSNPASIPENTIPEFTDPRVPPPVLYFISLVVVLAVAAVIAFLVLRWIRKNRNKDESLVLGDIAEIARSSLAEVSSGNSWEDVIIQCYARMNETVSTRRGVNRPEGFTPREFSAKLISAGLPPGPVDRLTRLFESVRYGARLSSEKEKQEATACLKTIIRECGGLS